MRPVYGNRQPVLGESHQQLYLVVYPGQYSWQVFQTLIEALHEEHLKLRVTLQALHLRDSFRFVSYFVMDGGVCGGLANRGLLLHRFTLIIITDE